MSGIGASLLKKMGWKEGTGIGKSGNGIVEPIKPRLKIGTEGIGFKEGERLCSGWWMDAFNRAAGASAADAPEAPKATAPALGRPYASAFSAASVLRDGCEESSEAAPPASRSADSPGAQLPRTPSDADLLAACGGRTAHCAARFGLGLSGKLARVRAQDQRGGGGCLESEEATISKPKKEKKRRRKRRDSQSEEDLTDSKPEKRRKRTPAGREPAE